MQGGNNLINVVLSDSPNTLSAMWSDLRPRIRVAVRRGDEEQGGETEQSTPRVVEHVLDSKYVF